MKTVGCESFGPVTAWEYGFSPVGRPLMTVRCYRLGGLLVDTGQRHMRRSVMSTALAGGVSAVVLTHHHEDHCGNAGAAAAAGIPVYAHPSAIEKLENGIRIRPYQHVIWGKADRLTPAALPAVIEEGPWRLLPIHAPGHSRDHTVFFAPDQGWLFSGDLFLAERIKYFRADEDLSVQIHTIGSILTLNFDALFCAHRPLPRGGKAALGRKRQFLEDCYGAVAALVARGAGEAEIIRRLDPGLDRRVRWFTLGNVSFAHLLRSAYRSVTAP